MPQYAPHPRRYAAPISSRVFRHGCVSNHLLSMLRFHAMKTTSILLLALTLAACQTKKSSYRSKEGIPIPAELISDIILKVPVATRDLLPGTILQASDISYAQLSMSDAPPAIPREIIGHKARYMIPKGAFFSTSIIEP